MKYAVSGNEHQHKPSNLNILDCWCKRRS